MRRLLLILAFVLAAGLLAPANAYAGDHDRARDAVSQGRVLPLASALAAARARYPGRLLDAQLGSRGGAQVYELKILQAGGQVVVVYVDARSGRVLGARGG